MPKTSNPPLLLDTHIWLWFVQGSDNLSPAMQNGLRHAALAARLRIAAISIWEIALLVSRERIKLGKSTLPWINEALAMSRTLLEPLSPAIAAEACELPGGFRSDLADQIIVATARITDAVLVTRDRRILSYAASGNVTARPA